jgi:hypothetical protein
LTRVFRDFFFSGPDGLGIFNEACCVIQKKVKIKKKPRIFFISIFCYALPVLLLSDTLLPVFMLPVPMLPVYVSPVFMLPVHMLPVYMAAFQILMKRRVEEVFSLLKEK